MVKKRFLLILALLPAYCFAGRQPASGEQTAPDPPHTWSQGQFRVEWTSGSLRVFRRHLNQDTLLLAPWHGESLLAVGSGALHHDEQRGSYRLSFDKAAGCDLMRIEAYAIRGDELELSGRFDGQSECRSRFVLAMRPRGTQLLELSLMADPERVRSIRLLSQLNASAWYRGLGAQPSRLDLKGSRFDLIAQEGGIGRGAQPLSALVDLVSPGSAGHAGSSYFPLPMMWSNKGWGLKLLDPEPAVWDFGSDRLSITQAGWRMYAWLGLADRPIDLIGVLNSDHGRQPPLPDWLHRGAIIGIQGGTARVRENWRRLQAMGTPISALWIQDWVGRRKTSIGSQLWWNWELDEQHYPDWQGLRADLSAADVRLLGYVNPFLVDVSKRPHHRNLYAEAAAKGYLVRKPGGGVYQVQNTDFEAGMLDLSQPAAESWFVEVLRQQLIESAGFSGWMADYGEALPLDASLGLDKALGFHNRYPAHWARLQAMAAADRDKVWFMRSGFRGSLAYAPLFWLGDQNVDWSPEDGLASCLTGLLSSGMSGIAVMHCDAGGYTSIAQLGLRRDHELLARWVELCAFTALLRTHEGNQPEANAQVYDEASIRHFAHMAKVFAALFPIRKAALQAAAEQGWPVVRHPALHYPEDEVAQTLTDQFMLGDELMIAPVLQASQTRRRLYLPRGDWIHLWSGERYGQAGSGQWVTVAAPLGSPPVFYPTGSQAGEALRQTLKSQGSL